MGLAALLGCQSVPAQQPDAQQPDAPATSVVTTPPVPVSAESPPAAEDAGPASEVEEDTAAPPSSHIVACPPRPADAGPVMCTREYRPVCAMVDTGVRCVTTPCPSAQFKTFGNGCSACANPKTTGYRPGACGAENPER